MSASSKNPAWLPSLAGISLIIPGQAWERELDWENCHIASNSLRLIEPSGSRVRDDRTGSGLRGLIWIGEIGDMGTSGQMVACYEEVEHNWIHRPSSHSHCLFVSACTVSYICSVQNEDSIYSQSFVHIMILLHGDCNSVTFKLESWYMIFIMLTKTPDPSCTWI